MRPKKFYCISCYPLLLFLCTPQASMFIIKRDKKNNDNEFLKLQCKGESLQSRFCYGLRDRALQFKLIWNTIVLNVIRNILSKKKYLALTFAQDKIMFETNY